MPGALAGLGRPQGLAGMCSGPGLVLVPVPTVCGSFLPGVSHCLPRDAATWFVWMGRGQAAFPGATPAGGELVAECKGGCQPGDTWEAHPGSEWHSRPSSHLGGPGAPRFALLQGSRQLLEEPVRDDPPSREVDGILEIARVLGASWLGQVSALAGEKCGGHRAGLPSRRLRRGESVSALSQQPALESGRPRRGCSEGT